MQEFRFYAMCGFKNCLLISGIPWLTLRPQEHGDINAKHGCRRRSHLPITSTTSEVPTFCKIQTYFSAFRFLSDSYILLLCLIQVVHLRLGSFKGQCPRAQNSKTVGAVAPKSKKVAPKLKKFQRHLCCIVRNSVGVTLYIAPCKEILRNIYK